MMLIEHGHQEGQSEHAHLLYMPGVPLKLIEKDKVLYSRKVPVSANKWQLRSELRLQQMKNRAAAETPK